MATGRTISANFLTEFDKQVLELCWEISSLLVDSIPEKSDKTIFKSTFAKMSKTTRDSGQGLGGGKLQRDALCTRGIGGKAPFSNRNLRWHPLVAAQKTISFAKPIERIDIEGETLNFVIKTSSGQIKSYPSEKVYELPERFVVLPHHWEPHLDILRTWNDVHWTQNSCIITAFEACNWYDAVQAYAILGISVAVGFFNANFDYIYAEVKKVLQNQTVDSNINLPDNTFPKQEASILCCPLCKVLSHENPASLPDRHREQRWKPEWGSNKRGEGEDGSLQIMHISPLTEGKIKHNAQNVRFGHRWCNVAMTDHSIDETLDFMEFIIKAHNRV